MLSAHAELDSERVPRHPTPAPTAFTFLSGLLQTNARGRAGKLACETTGLKDRERVVDPNRYKSAPFARLLNELHRLARSTRVPILLEGESGTGKSVIARYVHNCSPRSAASFHAVNIGAMDDALAGTELFGHIPGAVTDARQTRAGHFATANSGTLFLDEIGKAGWSVQRKLLQVIETGEMHPVGSDRSVRVDVRVLADPTAHSRTSSRKAASFQICTRGSKCFVFAFHHYANAARTFPCLCMTPSRRITGCADMSGSRRCRRT